MTITTTTRRTPLALLLWAAALLFGQSVALAHQHLDDAPGPSCFVCTYAQAQTAACDCASAGAAPLATFQPAVTADPPRFEASPPRHFRSRAPPRR